jgi:hypothetical protein
MQFVRDGDWYLATRITGPTHNLLGLRFGQPHGSHPAIERSSVGGGSPIIEADDVLKQVLDGLSDANTKLGTDYRVAAIRFITDDTPSSSAYRFLAKSIVERMVRQGAWSVKS